ncbi:MAG: hypothetical protein Q8S09_09940 [Hyphomonas sp.]|nr:hypothetical protein [Hyphomonas sp.]
MKTKILIAASLAVLGAGTSLAETRPGPPLMTLDQGVLTGEGATLLRAELPGAQFILIGEDHGFADPAELALALSRDARAHGVSHHVLETGPLTRDRLTDVLETGGPAELGTLLAGRPIAMPFVNMLEDAQLADYFVDEAGEVSDPLWGVDQEFIGAPLLHLETLKTLATTEAQTALVKKWLESEQAAMTSRNLGALMLTSAKAEDFAALNAAFEGNTEALEIVSALAESAEIYRLYFEGANYTSNAVRIDLMRRQFLEDYHASENKAPRALFKMGFNHLGHGTTPVNTLDLGSLTEGLAAANGLGVLRIAVLPLEGRQTTTNPSADDLFPVVEQRSEEVAALLAVLEISEEAIPREGYAVIAMEGAGRQLEQAGIAALSEQNRFLVLGYDFLITTRGARPATPLAR